MRDLPEVSPAPGYDYSLTERVLDLRDGYAAARLEAAAELLTGCEVRYISCRYWRDHAGWHVGPRTVPDTFLLLPTLGGFQLRLEGDEAWQDVPPGKVMLLLDDRRHELRIPPGVTVLEQVSLHCHVWDPYHLPVVRLFRDPVMTLPRADAWHRQLRDLCALHDVAPAAAAAQCANLMPALMVDLLLHGARTQQSAGSGDPRVLDTLVYIRKHLAQALTVPQLAARVGLQEGRLRALFQEELGMSPKQYVMQERLRRAAGQLRRSRRSVKAIAAEAGFPNSAYFNRCFRRYYERTPTAYRKAAGEL